MIVGLAWLVPFLAPVSGQHDPAPELARTYAYSAAANGTYAAPNRAHALQRPARGHGRRVVEPRARDCRLRARG